MCVIPRFHFGAYVHRDVPDELNNCLHDFLRRHQRAVVDVDGRNVLVHQDLIDAYPDEDDKIYRGLIKLRLKYMAPQEVSREVEVNGTYVAVHNDLMVAYPNASYDT